MAKRFDPYEIFCNILTNSDQANTYKTPDLIQERTHKVSRVKYLVSSYENGTHLQVMSVSVSTRVGKQDQPSECGQQERMGHAWGCF